LTPPPRAFAQTATPFYEKGNVRIHYQEAGSGFPLLIIPGGGQNSTISWIASPPPWCRSRSGSLP